MIATNLHISVTLTSEFRLEQALKQAGIEDPASVTRLTISGTLTDDDFRYIRENMSKTLHELDMSGASTDGNIIKARALKNCTGLTAVFIPSSTTQMNSLAFWGCTGLTFIAAHPGNGKALNRVNPVFSSEDGVLFNKEKTRLISYLRGRQGGYIIPTSVVRIDDYAFAGCNDLTSVMTHPDNPVFASENGVLFNKGKTKLILYPRGRKGDYSIPGSVVEIGHSAFFRCTGLSSVFIPDSVVKIGECAFAFSNKLISIDIPKSVIEIGEQAFEDCPANIIVNPDNSVYASESGKLRKRMKDD